MVLSVSIDRFPIESSFLLVAHMREMMAFLALSRSNPWSLGVIIVEDNQQLRAPLPTWRQQPRAPLPTRRPTPPRPEERLGWLVGGRELVTGQRTQASG